MSSSAFVSVTCEIGTSSCSSGSPVSGSIVDTSAKSYSTWSITLLTSPARALLTSARLVVCRWANTCTIIRGPVSTGTVVVVVDVAAGVVVGAAVVAAAVAGGAPGSVVVVVVVVV